MDHKLATIVGAAALISVPACGGALAQEASAVPVASSHAELLEPISNAVERLKISDAQDAARRPMLQQVQYGAPVDHHHHHHHHHSHDWYVQNGYRLLNGLWVTGDYYARHHHHHHHHHNNDYNYGYNR